jgi:putative colanic acid biosynthesis UDP-glucose lipid carrier transferase
LIVIIGVIFFTKTAYGFSRHWLALWSLFAFLAMSGVRFLIRAVLLRVRRHGFNQRSILLVGSASKNHDITCKLNGSTDYGFVVAGFFSPAEKRDAEDEAYAKRLGNVADLLPYLSENRVDQVWITLPLQEIELIEALYQELEKHAVEVRLLPDISSWRLLNHSVSEVIGMPVINITASPMNGVNQVVKWVEDKILSSLILLMISPILIVIAIAVKLTSPGPIFYRQERVSWNGKHFEMLKFRSMPVGSDLLGGKQVWGQAKAKQPTRLGAFLRRTSLDELPQFINVLKGDMSIVGPRPERPIFVDQFKHEVDRYMLKHLVKAGITGWAQVNGWRGDTCLKTRVEHDIYYIDNWSLWFDLKIILLTVFRPSVHSNAC